jgi:protease-4
MNSIDSPQAHPTPDHGQQSPSNWAQDTLGALLRAQQQEARRAWRWKWFFRMAWLLVGVAAVAWLWWPKAGATAAVGPYTALVALDGAIRADGGASAEKIMMGLQDAMEDEAVKAVVLRINSPGGSPVQAALVYDEIRRLRGLHNKPIYAVIEEMGTSAAYYIAAAADAIYVSPASVVGSIGVRMDGFGATELMQKLGVERRLLTAGKDKGFLDPFSPINPEQVAHAQALLGQIHAQFVAAVKAGRGAKLKEAPNVELFGGLFWTGQQAVALGLADDTGSVESVARDVVGAPDLVDFTDEEDLPTRLARRFGASAGAAFAQVVSQAGGWAWR